ncbi:CYTH domain-containing protein [Inhella crocodyli]|uniref:CYTH domain-containing protein n=2 Tax=Inhella crocodyli TaxID=2499851 RepID=A0A437LL65_9BURK|nr:CYTH domain-containing protein [Inhella crocodyli]
MRRWWRLARSGASGPARRRHTVGMSTELELRLAIPAAAAGAVAAHVAALPGARTVPLRATYFDTASSALGRAGWGLRLRWEGEAGWVQTIKGPLMADGLSRPEHNAARGTAAERPALDMHAHDALPEAAALLAGVPSPLLPQFGTEIERLRAQRTLAGGTRVELALDRGHLLGGSASAPVCELELEWLDGPLAPLWAEAERLVRAHGLVLEPRSKAARGHALARGEAVPPADWASVDATLAAISDWARSA